MKLFRRIIVELLCSLCCQGVQKLYELIVTFFGN